MPAYATAAQALAAVEGLTITDAPAFDRLLERASRDVDRVLGPLPIRRADPFMGFKLDPAVDLDAVGRAALARATAVQAAHRLRFVEPALAAAEAGERPAASVQGPDFTVTYSDHDLAGSRSLYSPDLPRELEPLAYLRPTGARALA